MGAGYLSILASMKRIERPLLPLEILIIVGIHVLGGLTAYFAMQLLR